MTLRQFGSVGELLVKLKADLEAAFPSFFKEFLSSKAANGEGGGSGGGSAANGGGSGSEDADDGVTLLLDLLKAIQGGAVFFRPLIPIQKPGQTGNLPLPC